MNLAAFVSPYLKEFSRSLSTALLVFASSPRCPDCVVTCQPLACPDCICREGVREAAHSQATSWWSYIVVALLSFQSGIFVHYLWSRYFTVIGSAVPKSRVPSVASIDSRPASESSLLKIVEDKVDVISTVSNDSDLHAAARSQVALLRKSRNGGSR